MLCEENLLVEGLTLRGISVTEDTSIVKALANLLSELVVIRVDGDDNGLARREPEGPLALEVLGKHSNHTLDRSKHGTVDHNRAVKAISSLEAQIKALGQLEVELHRGALVHAAHAIHDLDIDLGAVEGTITGVVAPVSGSGKLIEDLSKRVLCVIPEFDTLGRFESYCLLGARRSLKLVSHAESLVHVLHEVKRAQELTLELLLCAEDMTIILLEATHAGQA
mmetsp:Transcript_11357/g.22191  ORF Transcript_11357/g.22191 Transcript_11357/m.22191 type:complete len:223 (-) Transcript_11357:1090-1758(-)